MTINCSILYIATFFVSNTKKQISYEMENATDPLVKFSIPLTVDVKSGNNWNEAH